MWSRRRVLGGGLAASLPLLPFPVRSHDGMPKWPRSPVLRKFVDPLPMLPPLMTDRRHAGSPLYEIAVRAVRQRLHRDLPPTPLWAYGGQFPGPTLDVRRGQRIFVRWSNEITEPEFLLPRAFDPHLHGTHAGEPPTKIVTHVHGAVTQPDSDGHPDAWFTAGFARRGSEWSREVYEYPNSQQACTLWYHDHAIGQTRLNVYAGLAGAYIIRDDEEDAVGLPSGPYEIPLIVQDRSFAADGMLTYPVAEPRPGAHRGPWVPEYYGDTILVNGKAWPFLEVEPRKYRLRIVNGANARFFRFRLSDGRSFVQVGGDQGLLSAPVELRRLLLAPGERADVVVDFRGARGRAVRLLNDGPTPYPKGEAPDPRTTAQVMEFRVSLLPTGQDAVRIPTRLRAVAPLAEAGATVRHMALREYKDANGDPIVVLLNGRRWDAPISTRPRLGDTEVWHLINTTEDAHPIHLHLVRFQVLDRRPFKVEDYLAAWKAERPGDGPDPVPVAPYLQGRLKPPPPQERGWKDTVPVGPGEVVRIVARFDGYPGKYPWHCHMLEHEDNEMMLQFEVMPRTPG
jgi:spore coat protein A